MCNANYLPHTFAVKHVAARPLRAVLQIYSINRCWTPFAASRKIRLGLNGLYTCAIISFTHRPYLPSASPRPASPVPPDHSPDTSSVLLPPPHTVPSPPSS